MIIRHPRMLCVYMEQLNKCSKKKKSCEFVSMNKNML